MVIVNFTKWHLTLLGCIVANYIHTIIVVFHATHPCQHLECLFMIISINFNTTKCIIFLYDYGFDDFSGKFLLFGDDIYFFSFFFSSLRYTVGLRTLDISFFFFKVCIYSCKFPLCIASTAYHKFWYVTKTYVLHVFISFVSRYFLMSPVIPFLLTEYWTVGWLISTYFWIFQFSFSCWFLVSFYCVYRRNLAWFQSFQTYCFVTYHMNYPEKCSTHT